MLRSRSRSGSVDFGQKSHHHHSSVFPKTLFSSKLCRGDAIAAQIDASALKSVSNLSANHRVKGNIVQEEEEEKMREMEKREGSDDLVMEVESLKKVVAAAREEAKAKERKMGNLEAELGRMRQGEADKDASLGRLMKELRDARERETTNKKRLQDLEAELDRKRKSESSMARQLDSAMFELEESKIEIASLHEKIDGLEDLCNQTSNGDAEIRTLKAKLLRAQESEKRALAKADSLADEMEVLKREWKFAMEGEDKSSKAMEDLAMALKEVATESNQLKMQLTHKEDEIQPLKEEIERLKEEVVEAKQETEAHRNTSVRLRGESEETLLAWNAKEIGFIGCIKRAEEERALAQFENHKLAESLKAAENMTRSAREETYKLRDILKQAINESNAAKAAAGIARDENSLLKDYLAEKEEALHFITRENERLRISEAATQEHVKQLKRMLTMASAEIKLDEKDQVGIVMFTDDEDDGNGQRKVKREFSFDLDDLKFMNEPEDEFQDTLDEDAEKAEALKGSIFDTSAETPKSEVQTPKAAFFRLKTSSSSSPQEHDHVEEKKGEDGGGHEETEGDKQHGHRRSKTMFQRVGGLLTIRKSFQRKEPSIDQKAMPTQTQPTHV